MLRIKIYSKQKETSKGKKFRAFFTYMNIVVKGEEAKGKQRKAITIGFTQEVDTKNLKRGTLVINDNAMVNAPFIYEIKINKDGVKEYPKVWIKGYDEYIEELATHNQNDFDVSEKEESTESYSSEMPFEDEEKNNNGDDLPF